MDDELARVKRPSLLLWITEGGRALTELGLLLISKSFFMRKNVGDGHPVLVLPGFMTSDSSTKLLRRFIEDCGYNPYGWNMGTNFGSKDYIPKIRNRLLEVFEEKGEKVTLIGWSLGGVFAREIAKSDPEKVRQVITLGSPFAGIKEPNNAAWLYDLISKDRGIEDIPEELIESFPLPTPVPTTAIYSKEDGIVSWKVCLEKELNDIRQNVQVRGSHIGLGINPTVLNIIADRLQYREENWVKFKPKSNFFYPSF